MAPPSLGRRHGRVNSVTLSNRQRLAGSPTKSWTRLVAFLLAGTLVVYFGSHIFGQVGTSSKAHKETVSSVEDRPDMFRSDGEDANIHEAFLAGKKSEKSRSSASGPGSRSSPDIPISSDLPFLAGLAVDSTLRKAWKTALKELPETADTLYQEWFVEGDMELEVPEGIPGTGIDTGEEARAVQEYLDCVAGEGSWVEDPQGTHLAKVGSSLTVHKQSGSLATCDKAFYKGREAGLSDEQWDVRPSLKWRWQPSEKCKVPDSIDKGVATDYSLPSREELCRLLRHKHILVIGDSPTQYLLHDLLLDWTSDTTQTCYGDLYCKEHGICGGTLAERNNIGYSWKADARIFVDLPDPPGLEDETPKERRAMLPLVEKPPGEDDGTTNARAKADDSATRTSGTILRYRRSDSFFLNASPSHVRHQAVFVNPDTGIRDINMYAIPDSRRSDIVIISKAPIPLPSPANVASPRGQRLARLVSELREGEWSGESKAVKAFELAIILTKEVWLPELMESLRALKMPPAPEDNLIIYRGGWRMQPECGGTESGGRAAAEELDWQYPGDGPPPYTEQPTLKSILFPLTQFEDAIKPSTPLSNLHALIYNLQTILQNHLVRQYILPKLGIIFLDLETATSVWRSGFVGGAQAQAPLRAGDAPGKTGPQERGSEQKGPGLDCLRMCIPSPGLSLEEHFIGSLVRLFELGWGGQGKEETWVGRGFTPIRERSRLRQN